MARAILTGDKQIERLLRGLQDKAADRVAKSVINAELTALVKAQRRLAPVGKTGRLKKSLGKSLKRKAKTDYRAKAGLNVGTKTEKSLQTKKGRGQANHGHLVALGTRQRFRKTIGGKFAYVVRPSSTQLSAGVMPRNDFIRRATAQATAGLQAAGLKAAAKAIKRELAKARTGKR